MKKNAAHIAFRVTAAQLARIHELMQITGLNRSAVLQALIDNARVEYRPAPAATLTLDQAESEAEQ